MTDAYTVVVGRGRTRHVPTINDENAPLCRPTVQAEHRWDAPVKHLPICGVCKGAVALGSHPLLPVPLRRAAVRG